MKLLRDTVLTIFVLLAPLGVAEAQQSDEAAVWAVIEEQWEAVQRGDQKWVETLLAADFVAWPYDSPAPRDKGSTRMWNAFHQKNWKGKEHELYPLSIVVHGDMAIVHYLYTEAGENAERVLVVNNGRYTDVLVRVDGNWVFISRHGGADETDD